MKKQNSRIPSLDALRGLIMILMALDHAVFFVTKTHPLEYWGRPLPQYQSALPFLTRLSAHLCAPGFFFLMGVSMVPFADSRRRRDWSEGQIVRYFITRGLLLLVIQQFIVNPAWFLGTFGSTEILGSNGPPGGGGDVILNFDVLYGLGACMIVLSLLLRTRGIVVLAVSLGAMLATQALLPLPNHVDTLYSPLARLLLIPGQTGCMLVDFPVIPWVGMAGLGVVFGKQVVQNPARAFRGLAVAGAVSLALFVILRGIGGFGNFVPGGSGWIAFLNLTKYPPSLAFTSFTLGIDLLLLALLARLSQPLIRPLLTFGRTALFFYVAHLYLYALGGLAFPKGTGLIAAYFIWIAGIALLYPLCKWYGSFKRETAPNSVWRFFLR
jgi:uncharacterized membrane protein